MRPSLKKQIIIWLRQNQGWHKKVDLYVQFDKFGYSPETVGRQLRDLAESKEINVEYYDGTYSKNLAKYSIGEIINKRPQVTIEIVNGTPVAKLNT